jgi:hypothetical protein
MLEQGNGVDPRRLNELTNRSYKLAERHMPRVVPDAVLESLLK